MTPSTETASGVIPKEETADRRTPPPDPLVVTSDLDYVDANDDINTLREAFIYAQRHGAGLTISFSGDYEIWLSSPLSVAKDVEIDGGENKITLIGPDTEPMFQITGSKLTLKNLSLLSNRSGDGGGILDTTDAGSAVLLSVKDGGKAEWLWNISGGYDMRLDDGCHLHRMRINSPVSGNGAKVRIGTGCTLENSCISGASERWLGGSFDVYGHLKNASASDNGSIWLVRGETVSENLTVKSGGFIVHRPSCGVVNGLKVEFGGVYCYRQDVLLTGTVSIGGAVCTPLGMAAEKPIVGGETDIVFDLTERTGDSKFGFDFMADDYIYSISLSNPFPLIDNMKAFSGARSYAVRVKPDQASGTYKLAGNAAHFSSSLSIAVGDTLYPDALTMGISFPIEKRTYSLSLNQESALILTIGETQSGF